MSAVVETNLNFRPVCENDLDGIMEVEKAAYKFPWNTTIFRNCLNVGYQCWLLEETNNIIAYGVMTIAAGECHILNLCVDPEQQNKGYGTMMMEFLVDTAREFKIETVFLEVRPSNIQAIRLYRNIGFDEVGIRKNYYPARNNREDALIFAKTILN